MPQDGHIVYRLPRVEPSSLELAMRTEMVGRICTELWSIVGCGQLLQFDSETPTAKTLAPVPCSAIS